VIGRDHELSPAKGVIVSLTMAGVFWLVVGAIVILIARMP